MLETFCSQKITKIPTNQQVPMLQKKQGSFEMLGVL
jgi:hypothetical protein